MVIIVAYSLIDWIFETIKAVTSNALLITQLLSLIIFKDNYEPGRISFFGFCCVAHFYFGMGMGLYLSVDCGVL